MTTQEVDRIASHLALSPHPEGGFYRETWRSPRVLEGLSHGGPRAAMTLIHYVLPGGATSLFHRVRGSDEAWHFYDGDPLTLHVIDEGGAYERVVLGADLFAGHSRHAVVPAGAWQAAEVEGARHAHVGCTVAPGFDFADFDMAVRDEMLAAMPQHRVVIERLARP